MPEKRSVLGTILVSALRLLALAIVCAGLSAGIGTYRHRHQAYLSRAAELRELMKEYSTAKAEWAALELASLSVGHDIVTVRQGFGRAAYPWSNDLGDTPVFPQRPEGAEVWGVHFNPSIYIFFLVVDGVVVDWCGT